MSHPHLRRIGTLLAACGMVVVLLIAGTFTADNVRATQAAESTPVAPETHPIAIYFFWGDGCPHCAEAKPFLADLAQRYPEVEVRAYEVWYVEENQEFLWRMAAARSFEPSGVPTIFIGDKFWVGYAEQVRSQIEAAVAECSLSGCTDAGAGIMPGIPTPSPLGTLTETPTEASIVPALDNHAAVADTAVAAAPQTASQIELPIIGMVDLAAQSLAVSTALIAFVDGFNPCSLWVLSVLLALTLHTGSRRKVFWVGLVFLTVTSFIYMLFITSLFTMFHVVGFIGWIQSIVALVALFFAIVNIKDYFWYKEGISFSIADEKKPGIYQKMRKILDAGHSTWGMLTATVVLAAGVSLVEFSCTAGFPLLWTNLLISQQATAVTFILLLSLYMLIYQIDEVGIFLAAVLTLKASRLEEKQGRILKLIGGMLMLTLGVVMLVNPSLMNSLSTSLWVFAVAFAASAVVLLAHRKILPHFGMYIGTELRPRRQRRNFFRS